MTNDEIKKLEMERYHSGFYLRHLRLAEERGIGKTPEPISAEVVCSMHTLSALDEIIMYREPYLSLGNDFFAREHKVSGFFSIFSVKERVHYLFSINL